MKSIKYEANPEQPPRVLEVLMVLFTELLKKLGVVKTQIFDVTSQLAQMSRCSAIRGWPSFTVSDDEENQRLAIDNAVEQFE